MSGCRAIFFSGFCHIVFGFFHALLITFLPGSFTLLSGSKFWPDLVSGFCLTANFRMGTQGEETLDLIEVY